MQPLVGDYYYREMSAAEFDPLFRRFHSLVFADTISLNVRALLSDEEQMAARQLARALHGRYILRIGIYHEAKTFVGFHTGDQVSYDAFYMRSSGVLPEHQGRGIYSALLPLVLALAKEQGFQSVYSRHHATNNRIIIPKLRAGFVITGFELSDLHGLLVRLSYFFNPLRRQALEFRSGHERISDALRPYLDVEPSQNQ